MSYRYYIAEMSKAEYETIKDMTISELKDHMSMDVDDFLSPYDLAPYLYEFGKAIEFGQKEFIKPFFNNPDTQAAMNEDQAFYLVEAGFLKHVIDHYANKVIAYYTSLTKGVDPKNIKAEQAKALHHEAKAKLMEWTFNGTKPYSLERGAPVVTSWLYEYAVFELVRIHNTFDWENSVMVFYAC